MTDITLSETEGFRAWAKLMVENDDSFLIPELDAMLNFYNKDDSAYLVLDVYYNESEFTEYVFIASDENHSERAAILIFDFLKVVDFSLKKLIAWLEQADFDNPAIEERLQVCGIDICRSHPKKNEKRSKKGKA